LILRNIYHDDIKECTFWYSELFNKILIPFEDVIGSEGKINNNIIIYLKKKQEFLPFWFVDILIWIIIVIVIDWLRFWIIFVMITKFNNLQRRILKGLRQYKKLTGPRIDALTFGNGIGISPTSITK
jgi:hypothetical protein